MIWNWIGFGVLGLGWLAILWGLIRFFKIVNDEDDSA